MSGFDNEVLYAVGERLQPSDAQAITIMQDTLHDPSFTNVSRINHVGNPNNVVSANPGSLSHDPVSGFLWLKVSGTGTTVWQRIEAAPTAGFVQTLQGNAGPKVPPDGSGNINILLAHTNILTNGAGNTITADFLDPTFANLIMGSTVAQTLNPLLAQNLTSYGSSALNSVVSSKFCVALGGGALQSLTTGLYNTMTGASSGSNLVGSSSNTGDGYGSLNACVAGTGNTAVGALALTFALGSSNVAIGANAGLNYTGTEGSNVLLNHAGILGESNVMRLGTAGSQTSAYVSGITGVTVAASAPVGVASTGQLSSLGFGTATQVLTSNGAGVSPSWQSAGASALTLTSVTNGASPYTVLSTDEFLACQTSGGVITIRLPNAPTTGRVIYIKDSNGAAAVSNISVTTVGGVVTIDGSTTFTINSNYGSISVIFDGAAYEVF